MVDNAGNTLGSARSFNISSNLQTFTDTVDPTDTVDLYRFSVSYRSSFNLSLTNLQANANIALLDNSGTVLSVNGVPQTSQNTGTFAESINTVLNPGVYYIQVTPVGTASTSYALNVRSENNVRPDILWRNYATGQNLIWQMNGIVPTISSPVAPTVLDANWRSEATGDFTGDGQTDILWRNQTTGENLIWRMNGTSAIASISLLPNVTDLNWQIQAVGDFTNDGQLDVVWRNVSTGANLIWRMNGTTPLEAINLNPGVADGTWRIEGTGDFTGDGQTDLLWRNYTTGQNIIWRMNGTTAVQSISLLTISDTSWKIGGTGDFTRDGQVDIVWRNQVTGENVIWQMNGSTPVTTLNLNPFVRDLNWQISAPFNRVSEPPLIDVAGNSASASPLNLGTLTGNGVYKDFVGTTDSADVYKFTLATDSSLSASLTGLSQDLNLELLDSNGNPLSPGSANSGTTAESLTRTLTAGTYYIRVYQGSLSQSSNYNLAIAVNNAPNLAVPGAQQVDQGISLLVAGVSITDPDAIVSQVALTATNGALTLGSLTGLTFSTGDGTQDKTIVFTGSLANINTALAGLVYRPDTGFTGNDTLTVTVNDQGNGTLAAPLSDSDTIAITVTSINDPPVITLPSSPTVNEDIDSTITGIRIDDPDAFGSNLTVSLSVINGALTLGNTAGLTFSTGDGTADSDIVFTGPLTLINAALNNLIYRGKTNFSGTDTLTIQVSDNGNTGSGVALSDTETLTITVGAGNDPPVIAAPTTQTVNEDTSLTIVGVSVSDVDVGNGALTVSLSATSGNITLGSLAGLTFTTGDGTSDRLMEFRGSLTAINAALNNLVYQGNSNFAGTDSLVINVNDNGNTGGVSLSDTKTIAITVNSVNDAPVIAVPGALSATTGANLPISGIVVSDVDVVTTPFELTLTAANGFLSLSSIAGLTFSSGDGNQDSRMTFTGSLTALNDALRTLTYRSLGSFNGAETVTLAVTDRGNTGIGPWLSDVKTIAINVGNNPGVPIYNFGASTFSITEGNATNTNSTVVAITRSGNIGIASSVDVVFSGGTATAGTDYTPGPVTVNFAIGQTTAFVPISILGDTAIEPDETANLSLSNFTGGGQVGTTQPTATLTILNDDVPPPIYSFSAATYNTIEGNTTNISNGITLNRTGNLIAETVTITLQGTGANPATAGTDFTAGPLTVSFAAGQASANVAIDILGDGIIEPDETLALTLSSFSAGGTAGATNSAVLTIVNDDAPPPPVYSFAAANVSTPEGNIINTFGGITLNRTGNLIAETVTINVQGSGANPATAGTDFTAGPLTVVFAAGQASATVPISVLGDTVVEPDETLTLSLSSFSAGGSAGTTSSTTLTIANDDVPPPPPTYSFSSATFSTAEGNVTNTFSGITLNRTGNLIAETVTIALTGSGANSATAGTDFTTGPITVAFAAGQASATVPVSILGDTIVEPDETLTLSLTGFSAGGSAGTTGSTVLTIVNDDNPPPPTYSFSAANFSTAEGNATNTFSGITLNRTGNLIAETVTINLAGSGTNPATAGTDFTTGPITVSFAAGQTSATVDVNILGDTAVEPNETLTLSLTGFSAGGSAGSTSSTILTITNDDAPPPPPTYNFSAANFSTPEGNATNTFSGITLNRTGNLIAETVTVNLAGSGANPATAGTDFTAGPVTVSFAAGQASANVAIDILGDTVVEANETLTLTLGSFSAGGSAGTTSSTVLTITNDDTPPPLPATYSFSNANVSTSEGNATNTFNGITLNRTGNLVAETVTIDLLSSGANPATAGSDFTAGPLTVSFAAGQSSANVAIQILGDTTVESDETVTLNLTGFSAGGSAGAISNTVLTIVNDDVPPPPPVYSFSAANVSTVEGNATNTFNGITLNRTGDLIAETVTIDLQGTGANSATAGTDFTAGPVTVTFAAGQASANVAVEILGDTIAEPNETLTLTLTGFSAGGSAGTTNSTVLTLTNDDAPPPPPVYSFSVANVSTAEGNATNTFNGITLNRTGDLIAETVTINLTGSGTDPATAGTDFTAGPVTVTFAAGQASANVAVEILGDTTVEVNETLTLSLASFSAGGSAGTTSSTVLTITNDDTLPPPPPVYSFSAANVSTVEGNATNTFNGITLNRTGDLIAETVTINLTGSGTDPATAGTDFTAGPVTVTFAAGQTSANVAVEILGDTTVEVNETLTLSLASFSAGGSAGTTSSTVLTLTNDDVPPPPPTYSFSSAAFSAAEGNATNSFSGITLNRTGDLIAETVTIDLVGSGTNAATAGTDFTAGPITVNFAVGQTSANVSVELLGDTVTEPDETLTLSLTSFSAGGSAGTIGSTVLTIINDDNPPPPTYSFSATTYSTAEGDVTNTFSGITLNRTGDLIAETVTIDLVGSGTNAATAGTDFTAGPITVVFAAGQTSANVSVELLGDTVVEASETLTLSLTGFSAGGSAGATSSADLTLTNDDIPPPPPTYSFSNATFSTVEGNVTSSFSGITINRTGDLIAETVTIDLVGSGTNAATAGTDFTAGPITVNFAVGQTSANVSVELLGDTIVEPDETLTLSLTGFSAGGSAGTTSNAVLTLTNDDTPPPPPVYSFSSATFSTIEGNAANTFNSITLNRTGDLIAETVTINLVGSGANPATAGTDFTAGPITVSFAAGQASANVPIEILGDLDIEANESLTLSLGSFSAGGSAGTISSADLTLTDDDAPLVATYSFSATTFSTPEGNAANQFNGITLDRTGNLIAETVTIDLVGSGANAATAGTDFTAGPITVVFAAGQTSANVVVDILGDTDIEPNETLTLSLTGFSAGGVVGATSSTELTLTDDDTPPGATYSFSAATFSTPEGNATSTFSGITLNRTGNLVAETVTIDLAGSGLNAATPGTDFTAGPITVVFAAGQASANVAIDILGDTDVEFNETLTLSLSNFSAGGSIGATGSAILTIANDDIPPPPVYSFSAAAFSTPEGNATNTFSGITITRTGTLIAETITVDLAGSGIAPATAGTDFTAGPLTIAFAAGQTTATVPVSILGDTTIEASETLTLSLTGFSAGGSAGATSSTVLTLTDDDTAPPPTYSFSSATFSTIEGNGPNTTTGITLTRTGNLIAETVTIDLAGSGANSATVGTDFTAGPITVVFAAGQTSADVPINILGDPDFEANETLTMTMTGFSAGGSAATNNAVLTILNDDVGNAPLKDIYPGNSIADPRPANLIGLGNVLFFTANDNVNGTELWRSDGTPTGTVLLKDIYFGPNGSSPSKFTVVGSTLYFVADDGTTGPELWKSNGTAAGTVLVKDINGTAATSSIDLLTNVNGTLYFVADDGVNGIELWKSDGTTAGTQIVQNINPFAGSSPFSLTAIGNTLYFFANDGVNGVSLWKTTGSGASLVKSLAFGGVAPSNLFAVGSTLYFVADNGTGLELWKSDGTNAGTVLVKDINSGATGSSISSFTNFNGVLYFTATDGANGTELWKSDGTGAGTVMVKDINPTIGSSSSPSRLTVVGNTLYFRATDGVNGTELWKSDGTSAGTVMVQDINSTAAGANSNPDALISYNGALYFRANNGVDGVELWRSDGTSAGTVLVKDINPTGSSTPTALTVVNGKLFFVANDGTTGSELWVI